MRFVSPYQNKISDIMAQPSVLSECALFNFVHSQKQRLIFIFRNFSKAVPKHDY